MAKIKKRKLGWAASTSPQVIGYKLYWAEGEKVDYNSSAVVLGNVTEIVLPDDVEDFNPQGGPVEFGITAMDELGNESDMITFEAAYQFKAPQAPEELWMEAMDEYHAPKAQTGEADDEASEPILLFDKVVAKKDEDAPEEDSTADESEDDSAEPKTVQHYGQPEGE